MRTVNFEFADEEDFLIIKISGAVGINERLLTKNSLSPYLQHSHGKVIVDLYDLMETDGVYILGVLNTIKMEIQLVNGRVMFCSLNPKLNHYFKENRLDRIFDIKESVDEAKRSLEGRKNAVEK